jgi:chloramphenicol-sensitive protein RarD
MASPSPPQQDADTPRGFAFAVSAYLMWGFLPLYMKALASVPAIEVVAHRVLWSVPVAGVILIVLGRTADLKAALLSRRMMGMGALTAALISVNWGIYVWAIGSGHALDAALGYYINPLFSVFLGMVILRERLTPAQMAAIALAACAIALVTWEAGRLPVVALMLTVTWGFYALLKKSLPIGPNQGFMLEVLILLPLALAYLAWLWGQGSFHFGQEAGISWLLAGTGIVTAVPLMVYANGAKLLRLSTIGILQYIAPTMIFLTAVFLFGEPFSGTRLAAFGLIWVALAVYSFELVRMSRRAGYPGGEIHVDFVCGKHVFSGCCAGGSVRSADPPAADRHGHAGGRGAGGGQAHGHADGEEGEGLRLEHVAVEAAGFDRIDGYRHAAGQFGHQHRIAPPAAGDKDLRNRRGKMLGPARGGGGGAGGQGGGGVGIVQASDGLKDGVEIVAVQRLRRHPVKPRMGEEALQQGFLDLAPGGKAAVLIMGRAATGAHQVVDGRIGGAGVEGQAGARRLGRGMARIDPGEVADAAKVEEGHRHGGPDVACAGEVEEGGQRCPLPAHGHVGGAEIPDHGQAQHLCQKRAVARLMRALPARIMGQRLAVEAHDLGPLEAREQFGMGGFDHFGGALGRGAAGPVAKGRAQCFAFGRGVGAIARGAEFQDAVPVGQHHGGIDPVQRGARHRAKRPDRPLQHGFPLPHGIAIPRPAPQTTGRP